MRRLLISAGLAVGLLLSSAPTAPMALAAEPVAKSAKVAKPSERALSLARRYFVAMQFEQMMMSTFEAMDVFGELEEDAEGFDGKAMSSAAREATQALLPRMVDAMIPIVAQTFTEAELEAMVAFYESDVGKSVVAKSNDLNMPMMAAMMELMPEYIDDMVTLYCQKTTCTPSMRDKLRKHSS